MYAQQSSSGAVWAGAVPGPWPSPAFRNPPGVAAEAPGPAELAAAAATGEAAEEAAATGQGPGSGRAFQRVKSDEWLHLKARRNPPSLFPSNPPSPGLRGPLTALGYPAQPQCTAPPDRVPLLQR